MDGTLRKILLITLIVIILFLAIAIITTEDEVKKLKKRMDAYDQYFIALGMDKATIEFKKAKYAAGGPMDKI